MGRESNGKSPANLETQQELLIPKAEIMDFDELPPQTVYASNIGDNAPSSSGSKLRSFFIGMGFLPSLVDQAIEENGEDNVDLLLERLFTYSALQKSNHHSFDPQDSSHSGYRHTTTIPNFAAESNLKEALQKSSSSLSESADSYFGQPDPPEVSTILQPKDEPYDPYESDEVINDARTSLLMMNFSVNEVEVAISKLGNEAPIDVLVDFITAAQIAYKQLDDEPDTNNFEVKYEDKDENLFGTMEKTLELLQMGFSENEVSTAFELLGQDAPITELANAIFMDENEIRNYRRKYKLKSSSKSHFQDMDCKPFAAGPEGVQHGHSTIKSEVYTQDVPAPSENINLEAYVSEELKEEFTDATSDAGYLYADNHKGKRPKMEYDDPCSTLGSPWMEEKVHAQNPELGVPNFTPAPCRSLSRVIANRPYFFYGNFVSTSSDDWRKISQFLYAIEPEFVNTQFFSAMNRREGYVHNLPAENRFRIIPKAPMTIQDAIPNAKRWWPSWDKRKQLSCINCERNGILQLCDRLGRILVESRGEPSTQQKIEILHHCRTLDLVWVGKHELGPMEPEILELILGYPPNHTQGFDYNATERLRLLKYCFQTHTLGYHLSELKFLFPEGLTMLSLFSGIGGVEIALNRLGIRLKTVVSVETCEKRRKILKGWWHASRQDGNLVQVEDIQKLSNTKLESLVKTYGTFDFITCQNPCSHNTNSKVFVDGTSLTAYDFSLFCEFVRILRSVRSMCAR